MIKKLVLVGTLLGSFGTPLFGENYWYDSSAYQSGCAVSFVGGVLASGVLFGCYLGAKALVKKALWNEAQAISWIHQTLTLFTELRYKELIATADSPTDEVITALFSIGQTAPAVKLRADECGFAPLHNAQDVIEQDLQTLSQILIECIERNLISHDFFTQALLLTRLLEKSVKGIVISPHYTKEALDLEKCRSERATAAAVNDLGRNLNQGLRSLAGDNR